MPSPTLDKPLIHALLQVYALTNDVKPQQGTLPLLRLLNKLNPNPAHGQLMEAQELYRIRDFRGARQLLETADASAPDTPMIKAMLAATLYAQRDRLWESYAAEVAALPANPRAQSIIDFVHRAHRGEVEPAAPVDATPEPVAEPLHYQYMGRAC